MTRETPDQVRQVTDAAFKISDISIYQRAHNFWGQTPDQRKAFIERAISWTARYLGNKDIVNEALKQIGLSTRNGFPEIIQGLPESISAHLTTCLGQGDSTNYFADVVKVADQIPDLAKRLPEAVAKGFAAAVKNGKNGSYFMQSFLKAGIKRPGLLNGLSGHHVSEPSLPHKGYGHAVITIMENNNSDRDPILIYDLKGSVYTPLKLRERWEQSIRPTHKDAMLGALTDHFTKLAYGTLPAPAWVRPLAANAFTPPPAPPKKKSGWGRDY